MTGTRSGTRLWKDIPPEERLSRFEDLPNPWVTAHVGCLAATPVYCAGIGFRYRRCRMPLKGDRVFCSQHAPDRPPRRWERAWREGDPYLWTEGMAEDYMTHVLVTMVSQLVPAA